MNSSDQNAPVSEEAEALGTECRKGSERLRTLRPELPKLMGGAVGNDDGSWEAILTMGQGEIPDQLTIRYYDEDKAYMGEIVFEKQ